MDPDQDEFTAETTNSDVVSAPLDETEILREINNFAVVLSFKQTTLKINLGVN